MTGYELEKKAWSEFDKWCDDWRRDHQDQDVDTYTLAVIYGEGGQYEMHHSRA